ncbi:hypothetical protein ACIRH0_09080 [Streptomyces sp. NPDC093675]|uniref:hypothetical protein n=1 Tax=Streptomyces sp. NPDC093675 TaxID=3366049 RepID=UPI003803B1E4
MPPRRGDVGVLAILGQPLLWWMSEGFLTAAWHLVVHGVTDAHRQLIELARAILRDGGHRSEGQSCIALVTSPVPAD